MVSEVRSRPLIADDIAQRLEGAIMCVHSAARPCSARAGDPGSETKAPCCYGGAFVMKELLRLRMAFRRLKCVGNRESWRDLVDRRVRNPLRGQTLSTA